ncbi:MAG: polyprenyl synthetase family protein [Bacteroidales bacterium]|nr:polyprenyl synthetase family protein [Bacteroidales bacterium]MDZ4204599.1 polyprenyl synthetase family protein [Bacteroidales bacterium]
MGANRYLELVENSIAGIEYPLVPKGLYEPIRYTLSNTGKRLRPVLTLMSCELFGGKAEDAIYPAVSLELLHNFTLIHDDIMDRAPLRRGLETVYRKWNLNIAILAGDTLFAMAYDFLNHTPSGKLPQVLHVFNSIAIQICEGQQHDMNFEQKNEVSIDEYMEMIRLKTAVFFGGCMQIGALIGGADKKQAELIYQYGEQLGIAFQMQDDILDVFGSVETFGKKPGGDIVANKKTLLYLNALELADAPTSKRLKKLYSIQPKDTTHKVEEVMQIFAQLNIRHHAENLMDQFYESALENLAQIDADASSKKAFKNFTLNMLKRNKIDGRK